MKQLIILIIFCIGLLASSCESDTPKKSKKINKPKSKSIVNLKYSVDAKIPHSSNSFTEGLQLHEGLLYESTGSPDNLPSTTSVYGTIDTVTGEINTHAKLESKYFGEGICILNNKVYQLTYKSRIGFVYDLHTKKQIKTFEIPTKEGWGLTTDGESLIMTDGSANLHFIDPNTMEKTGTVKVFNNGRPLMYLNEVEYVNGFVYANVYTTDWIVKINPETGKVLAKLDVTDIKLEEDKLSSSALETNGIAYNASTKQFYVTGKMWQNIYVISIFE
ncbi:MAG: glutaminyl-peptide cyclotransferase [Salibacteraceae bacterium]